MVAHTTTQHVMPDRRGISTQHRKERITTGEPEGTPKMMRQHKCRTWCSKRLLSQQGNNKNISRSEVIIYPKRELP